MISSIARNGIIICDERLDNIKSKIMKYNFILSLGKNDILSLVMNEGMNEDDFIKQIQETIKNYENNLKMINIEKMVYEALTKTNNSNLFPKLLAKYDELTTLSYDLAGDLIYLEGIKEGDYLDYCIDSLKTRHFVKEMCDYGEKTNK